MNAKTEIVMVSLVFLLLAGCGLIPARIKSGDSSVSGVKNAGSPATLATGDKTTSLPLGDGSSLTVTKFEAQAAILAKDGKTVTQALPAKTVTEVHLAGPSILSTTEKTVSANTGTVDTSIAEHQIDSASRAPLLYGALLCGAAAVFFVWRAYPTPAMLSGIGAAVCLVAWKVTDLPAWMWGVAVLAGGVAFGIYQGHERAEKTLTPVPATQTPNPPTK